MAYLTDIFFPSFLVYCGLFLVETATLYLYWYGWDAMSEGNGKKFHIFLGFMLNVFAFFIMIVPNSWATFQASPVVIAEGTDFERAWAATWNPTWWPVNIHRIIANVVLGGYICGAYAGIRYLSAKSAEERYHYDWMGYVGNFIGVFGLLPLPFAGYWLMREIYQYNQQMGITLMGGFLSWLFILQAMLIGVLFLGSNYYFWMGITHRIPGSESQYRKPIMAMLIILLMCLAVWMTPHSLVASLEEAQKMGGTHHPLLGVFGVMSAKMTVSNLMVLVTFMSFIMYWRAGKEDTAGWAKVAKSVMGAVLVLAGLAVIVLGVWGYFVPAIIRINYFSTSQVAIVIFVMLTITPLTALLLKSAKTTTEMVWGAHAATGGLFTGVECGYGHPVDDSDGVCPFLIPSPLARLRCHARFFSVRLLSCARLCRRADGAEHVPLLLTCGLHFLGRYHGRQGQGCRERQEFHRTRWDTGHGGRLAGVGRSCHRRQ
jgi:cytochrome d ubiquinol oxidase subunit I